MATRLFKIGEMSNSGIFKFFHFEMGYDSLLSVLNIVLGDDGQQ
jgi:hypothetical protein